MIKGKSATDPDWLFLSQMLEASLSRLLDGRQISETTSNALKASHPEIHAKFWGQLQTLLKNMLASTLAASGSKSPAHTVSIPSKPGDAAKLKELYRMSLTSTEFSQLHVMHSLWISWVDLKLRFVILSWNTSVQNRYSTEMDWFLDILHKCTVSEPKLIHGCNRSMSPTKWFRGGFEL